MRVSCSDVLPLVHDTLQQGGRARLTVSGASMRPFIHSGSVVELATVMPGSLTPGMVVLVEKADGRHVLHRVIRVTPRGVFTRGDANFHEEGPFAFNQILAMVTGIVRGNHVRHLDVGIYGALPRLWYATPIGLSLLTVHDFSRMLARRVLRRLGFRS